MTAPITVLICDDDVRICAALEAVIDSQPDLVLAAIAHDSTRAIALARQHRPRLAIVDVRMPGLGPTAVRGIREHAPDTKILAFSAQSREEAADAMLRAGAHHYLPKGTSLSEILATIRRLAHAGTDQSPE